MNIHQLLGGAISKMDAYEEDVTDVTLKEMVCAIELLAKYLEKTVNDWQSAELMRAASGDIARLALLPEEDLCPRHGKIWEILKAYVSALSDTYSNNDGVNLN